MPKNNLAVEDVLASGLSGIAWGGGLFAVLLSVLTIIPSATLGRLVISCLLLPVLFIIGAVVAGVASLISVIAFMLFHWSVDSPFGARPALSLVGSGTGFLAVAHTTGTFSQHWTKALEFFGTSLPLMFITAMLLGHMSAIVAVNRKHPGLMRSRDSYKLNFQFSIQHILIVTAWSAGSCWLTVQFGKHILVLLLIGMLCQNIILGGDYLWCRMRGWEEPTGSEG
ncbi:MAG: hypothetical protein U0930_07385 [Pirellulales bacterium]